VSALGALSQAGDVIIDGGNSYFEDDVRRAKALDGKRIHHLGVGTSAGRPSRSSRRQFARRCSPPRFTLASVLARSAPSPRNYSGRCARNSAATSSAPPEG